MSGKLPKTASAITPRTCTGGKASKTNMTTLPCAADAVGDIDRGFRRHGIAVRGDVGGQQRVGARIHADDRDARIRRRLQARADLGGIDVDDDGVDALGHHILDPADDRGDVARGVDHVDRPAQFRRAGLEAFDIELRAGLGEVGRDHRHLLRQRAAPADSASMLATMPAFTFIRLSSPRFRP